MLSFVVRVGRAYVRSGCAEVTLGGDGTAVPEEPPELTSDCPFANGSRTIMPATRTGELDALQVVSGHEGRGRSRSTGTDRGSERRPEVIALALPLTETTCRSRSVWFFPKSPVARRISDPEIHRHNHCAGPLPAVGGRSDRIRDSTCFHTLGSHSIWV